MGSTQGRCFRSKCVKDIKVEYVEYVIDGVVICSAIGSVVFIGVSLHMISKAIEKRILDE